MQRRTDMQPIGIFFAALLGFGIVGVVAVMAVSHFRRKDIEAKQTFTAVDYDSREMYEK